MKSALGTLISFLVLVYFLMASAGRAETASVRQPSFTVESIATGSAVQIPSLMNTGYR